MIMEFMFVTACVFPGEIPKEECGGDVKNIPPKCVSIGEESEPPISLWLSSSTYVYLPYLLVQ